MTRFENSSIFSHCCIKNAAQGCISNLNTIIKTFVVQKVGSAAAAFMSQCMRLFQTFLLSLEISSLSSELHTSDWLLHMFVCCLFLTGETVSEYL